MLTGIRAQFQGMSLLELPPTVCLRLLQPPDAGGCIIKTHQAFGLSSCQRHGMSSDEHQNVTITISMDKSVPAGLLAVAGCR